MDSARRILKENIAKFDLFPRELVDKLDKVIQGGPIENIVYELDDIEKKYLKD